MLELELVVDCMRAGLKNKSGGFEWGRSPSRGGVGGGGAPPLFANVLAFSPRKSFENRLLSISSSNNNNSTTSSSSSRVVVVVAVVVSSSLY